MRLLTADIDPFKSNPSLLRRNDPHDAPERRGLASTISTEEGDQFSLFYFRKDPLEDMAFAIKSVDILKNKHLNPSQISLLDFLIVRDLGGRPFCQDTSLIQHRNDVRDRKDDIDVMFDDENRNIL